MKKGQMIVGAIACLIASMSWGAMFPVADHTIEYINPFYFTILRYGAVSILLFILLWMREGKKSFSLEGKGKLLVFFGTMAFTIYNVLMFLGQKMMGEAGIMVASIMEALMPMISISILWIYKGVKPKKYMISSMIIAFVGATFVITKGEMSFLLALKYNIYPIVIIFIGVIGWVIYTMGGQSFSGWSTLRYSTLTCVFGTVVSVIITIIITMLGYISVPRLEIIYAVKYDLLFMMLLPGIVALLSWNYGVKILSSINGILFINFVPITTLIIMIFQGYKITIFDIVGTLLVIIALIRNNLYQRKEENRNKQMLFEGKLRKAN